MNLSNDQLKFLAAASLIAVWLGLVLLGKADASQFVNMIEGALLGLGVYHSALHDPKE